MKRLILAIVLVVGWCAPSQAAITLLAGFPVLASGVNGWTTASANTTGATLIVVVSTAYANRPTATPFTDSASNSYTGRTNQYEAGSLSTARIYDVTSPTTSASHTWTWEGGGNFDCADVWIYAFSGTATGTAFDVQNGATVASAATTAQPGSVTPSNAGSLILTAVSNNVNSTAAFTINQSFTASTGVGFAGGGPSNGSAAYLIQGTAAALNPTWSGLSGSGGTGVALVIAVYKPGAGGAACTPTLSLLGVGRCN